MPRKIINEILGLAATDNAFAQELLANPVDALEKRGYQLTVEERKVFQSGIFDTLTAFSQHVHRYLAESPMISEDK